MSEPTDQIDSEDSIEVEAEMFEVETMIAESDPEFLKQMSDIKIDNADLDLSLMDFALAGKKPKNDWAKNLLKNLKAVVDVRNNAKKVILFWLSLFTVLSVTYYFMKIFPWGKADALFLRSYSEWGGLVQEYNPAVEVESFFDNARLNKNLITIRKMVVNLKPSEQSSANPMLAFEITIEGMTNEVVVEIKDREAELKDLILRTTEDFTYDELSSVTGKQNLTEKLLLTVNSQLTKGHIRKIFYKSFVLKI